MRDVRLLLPALFLFIASIPAMAAGPAAPPPTTGPADDTSPLMQELHTRFDVGDYDGVLRTIAHALAGGPRAIEGTSKHELLVMRGEAQLRLKQTESAAAAFHEASKATDNPEKSATDLATELLIRRSRLLKYTPKPPSDEDQKRPAPIDIVAADHRKLAFRALFADEWATVAPKLKAAKDTSSVVVIMDAIKAIQAHQLRTLDLTANGNDDQTHQALNKLRDHAADLLSRGLEALGKREQEISSSANEIIHQQVMSPGPFGGFIPTDLVRRRGLQGSDRQDLENISRTAAQIAAAAQNIIGALDDRSAANDLVEQANDVIRRAKKAQDADYGHA